MIGFWKHSAKSFDARSRLASGRSAHRLLGVLLAFVLLACAGQQKVERRQGEHIELGRSVPPSAYAWYARGRHLERLGQYELAREAYTAVLARDPRSGAAWAGLGSTYCATEPDRARATFSKGLARAAERLPIYVAQASCELDWSALDRALDSAEKAFHLAPAAPEASEVLAAALNRAGRTEEAQRVQRGQRLYSRGTKAVPLHAATAGEVDRALARGDVGLAETLSLELMTKSTLAVRALAIGRADYASEQAALVAAASPDDVSAWAVLALTGDGPSDPRAEMSDARDLLSCLWTEHLRRRVGPSGAAAFLAALDQGKAQSELEAWRTAGDPLLLACAARLQERGLGSSTSAPP